jgi:hypothetical protein
MRRLIHALVIFVSVLGAAACQPPATAVPTPTSRVPTPHPSLPAEPDPNFALHFEYGVCYMHVLDTEAGTYQRQVPGETVVEIPLVISDADMAAIYAKLVAIDFLGYPARFAVPVPTDGVVIEVLPWTTYQLTVRNGDTRHTVAWDDKNPNSSDPGGQRLRELFRLISGVVGLRPEVLALPTPNIGCV